MASEIKSCSIGVAGSVRGLAGIEQALERVTTAISMANVENRFMNCVLESKCAACFVNLASVLRSFFIGLPARYWNQPGSIAAQSSAIWNCRYH
jgi:hypothetical protein